MKITLFLGAGASMPCGFPDTVQFKTDLEDHLKANLKNHLKVNPENNLKTNPDGQMALVLTKSGYADIENLLSDLEELEQIDSNRGWQLLKKFMHLKYVNNDNPNTDSLDFNQVLQECKKYEQKIKKRIYQEYSWKREQDDNLKQLYDNVFAILHNSEDEIHICTTNYDRVMEHYIDKNKSLIRIDGFTNDVSERKDLFDPKVFNTSYDHKSNNTKCYLYKLHGSLNWIQHPDNEKIWQREDVETYQDGSNFVIYPTKSKEETRYVKEPYSTLMKKFRECISNSDVFIVIGYSFRDDIINKQFKKFLNKDHTKIFVISPDAEQDTREFFNDVITSCSMHFAGPDQQNIQQFLQWYNDNNGDTLGPNEIKAPLESILPDFSDEKIKIYNFVSKLENANDKMFEMIRIIVRMHNFRS